MGVPHRAAAAVFAALVVALGGGGVASGVLDGAAPGPPTFAADLRYIGRDPATGLPARVDDRFLAETEEAIARYGRDAREPVPPPPPGPVDLRSVSIPALGLADVPVQRLGLDAFGRLDVPQDTATIGWNPAYTVLPGEGGSTFLAAHYEYGGRPGVFFRLAGLQPGDTITLARSDGESFVYRAVSVVDYPLAAIDMGAVLQGREGVESVILMTCSGPPDEGNYPLRTVVIAERVLP